MSDDDPIVVDLRGKPISVDDLKAAWRTIMRAPVMPPGPILFMSPQQKADVDALHKRYRDFLEEMKRAPRFRFTPYKINETKGPCRRCGKHTRFCRPYGDRWTPIHLRCETSPASTKYERRGPVPDFRLGDYDEMGEREQRDLNRHDRRHGYVDA